MLSATEVKNGSRVEAAADRVCLEGEGVWWGHCTISQVAKECGMSKPTVKKYMDILVKHGAYSEVERDTRYCTPTTTRMYRIRKTLVNVG